MTLDTTALEIAIRAEEAAKSAHHRLDKMNGSIDRLAAQVFATNGKIDTIAAAVTRTEGVEEGKQTVKTLQIDSRRFVVTTVVALFAAVAYLAFNVHVSVGAPVKPLKWQPDRPFAKVVKAGFEAANKGVTVTEDVCLRPALPKNTALTAGVPQEDCLVVAAGAKGGVCFEMEWQNGATGTRYPCVLVRKAIRRDTKAAWVVHYPAPLTA